MEKKPRQWPPEGHRFVGSLEDEIKRANDELAWQLYLQEIQSDEAFAKLVSTYPPGALDVPVVLETKPCVPSEPEPLPENALEAVSIPPRRRLRRRSDRDPTIEQAITILEIDPNTRKFTFAAVRILREARKQKSAFGHEMAKNILDRYPGSMGRQALSKQVARRLKELKENGHGTCLG